MKHFLISATALVALFSVSTAFAQKPGVHELAPTTFNVDVDQHIVICYDIAGLGNVSSVNATVTYDVTVNTYCTTKGKGHGTADNPVPAFSDHKTDESQTINLPVRNGRASGCKDLLNTITCAQGVCPPGLNSVCTATYSNVSLTVQGHTFPATLTK